MMNLEASGWQVLRPAEHIYAFYAGRPEGGLPEPEQMTWVEEGALSLGVASYAIVDGDEALVYDTHTTLDHARAVRRELHAAGVEHITVLLSHWHLDHIAGTEVFADCEILAGELTNERLTSHREAIESGTHEGPPAINPLIMPTRVLRGPQRWQVRSLTVEMFPADIHSQDHYLLWLPETRTLLAADAVEDTITYVAEPERLEAHLAELDKLGELHAERILPAHGNPQIIASGGYGPGIITATQDYVLSLLLARTNPDQLPANLHDWIADAVEREWITYYEPYEQVHRANLALLGQLRARD